MTWPLPEGLARRREVRANACGRAAAASRSPGAGLAFSPQDPDDRLLGWPEVAEPSPWAAGLSEPLAGQGQSGAWGRGSPESLGRPGGSAWPSSLCQATPLGERVRGAPLLRGGGRSSPAEDPAGPGWRRGRPGVGLWTSWGPMTGNPLHRVCLGRLEGGDQGGADSAPAVSAAPQRGPVKGWGWTRATPVTLFHPLQGLALESVNKYLLTEDVMAQGSGGGG